MRDDNLTFHRFPTDMSSIDSRRQSEDHMFSSTAPNTSSATTATNKYLAKDTFVTGIWTTGIATSNLPLQQQHARATTDAQQTTASSTATTPGQISTTNLYKNSYTTDTNDFQYIPSNGSSTRDKSVKSLQNGSTAKLVAADDDQSNKQVRRLFFFYFYEISN